jgi:hypothetical protein
VEHAQDSVGKAVVTMEGFEVPPAAWRVHATAAHLHLGMGNGGLAERHRNLSRATILALATSLTAEEQLRKIFLSSPAVSTVLRGVEQADGEP